MGPVTTRRLRPRPSWAGRRSLRIALSLALAIGAVVAAVPRSPGADVLVVTADLPSGHVLTAGDLRTEPAGDRPPDGALEDPAEATGARLSGAARRGETLTDARLGRRPDKGAIGEADTRVVTVSVPDVGLLAALRPGDVVDVITVPPAQGHPTPPFLPIDPVVVAPGAVVVEVSRPDGSRSGQGRSVLVRLPTEPAARVAGLSLDAPVALTVHG